ncbi:hypothetical protein [Brevibacterium samyangense]|uniref:WXG100 family type VII secretion target n=1 Tax=Brevibacterium samyangense TaxID=366888 RepID=A0ABN2T524_9MICO
MTIAAPEVFDAPKGDENSLDASANTLRNKVGAIGTTLSTYTERTTSAMDAMASVGAQQLFSYVGKATSMLQNAQESAGSAGTAIADYASELSEVKQELESLRHQWVDLAEDDKALSESYRVWAQRACVAEPEIEGTDGVTWDQLGAPPVVLSATGRDLGLPFTGKEYPVVGQLISMAQVDLELIKARTGMTLADLGYDTPEEQLAWLTGEGAQMREHELRYQELHRGRLRAHPILHRRTRMADSYGGTSSRTIRIRTRGHGDSHVGPSTAPGSTGSISTIGGTVGSLLRRSFRTVIGPPSSTRIRTIATSIR